MVKVFLLQKEETHEEILHKIDSGSTIHVSNTLWGIENLRKPVGGGQYIYLGGRISSHVDAIGTLAPLGFSFNFLDTSFTLSNKTEIISFCALIDGLYEIKLQNAAYSMHVLSTLGFDNFETCIDCIKGKQTNKFNTGAKRSTYVLDFIHINICYPDMNTSSLKYFITFINDYSRYMYLYLLCSIDEDLNAFKVFKAEVEKQYGKQIKIVRFDRGGEYYRRYIEKGQAPGPFVKFLQEHGIVA
ncbi:hypothetical protein CR513_13827, partial [Mucuna pruriens]